MRYQVVCLFCGMSTHFQLVASVIGVNVRNARHASIALQILQQQLLQQLLPIFE